MEHSEKIDELAAALVAFGSAVTDPPAKRVADTGKYKYRYADLADILEVVRPVLAELKLAVTQEIINGSNAIGVQTMIVHESGQFLASSPFSLPSAGESAQDYGSVVTYARRYSLLAALNLATIDDDAAPKSKGFTRPITAKQASKIAHDFEALGLKDDAIARNLARYGVATVSELTTAQASNLIDRIAVEAERQKAAREAGADPVTGEVAGGTDEVPGMDAEEFNAARERQAQEQDDDRLC